MKNGIFAWGLLAALAVPARADIVDGGNLQIGGQGVFGGTLTVQGNALGVAGSISATSATVSGTGAQAYALTTSSGIHILNGKLKLDSGAMIQWPDGTTSTTAAGGSGNAVASSTFVYLCGGDQTPSAGQNTQASAATVTNSTSSLTFSMGSWAEVSVTFFHQADGTQYNADLYIDNARPAWVGSNGILPCQGSASSIIGTCTAVLPIPIAASGSHSFYWKVWRGGNPVTLRMSNPCSYYTVKEIRSN